MSHHTPTCENVAHGVVEVIPTIITVIIRVSSPKGAEIAHVRYFGPPVAADEVRNVAGARHKTTERGWVCKRQDKDRMMLKKILTVSDFRFCGITV